MLDRDNGRKMSRRDFLKYLGAAAAAVATGTITAGGVARGAVAESQAQTPSWQKYGRIEREKFNLQAFAAETRPTGIFLSDGNELCMGDFSGVTILTSGGDAYYTSFKELGTSKDNRGAYYTRNLKLTELKKGDQIVGYQAKVTRAQNLDTEGASKIQIWTSANGWDWSLAE